MCAISFSLGNFRNGGGEMSVQLTGIQMMPPQKTILPLVFLQKFFRTNHVTRSSPWQRKTAFLQLASQRLLFGGDQRIFPPNPNDRHQTLMTHSLHTCELTVHSHSTQHALIRSPPTHLISTTNHKQHTYANSLNIVFMQILTADSGVSHDSESRDMYNLYFYQIYFFFIST